MAALLLELNLDLQAVVDKARKGLVRIEDGRGAAGAGAVWHPQGLIVTNAHVAGRRELAVIDSDGRKWLGRVLARDERLDLAVVLVDTAGSGWREIELGSSRSLKVGQWCMALGYPWGVEAATAGVVIGVGQNLPGLPLSDREVVAVSLPLRPGHSGGLLVDERARLVGINTVMAGPEVGLAVAVDEAKRFVRRVLGSRAS